MLALVGETAGLALDFLEKNDCLLPFCKVVTRDGKPLMITPGDEGQDKDDYIELCADSVWIELKRRISSGTVAQFAFCSDSFVKFQGDPTERRTLRIEFQNGTEETGVYYFPLSIENGKASVGSYRIGDVRDKLL